MWAFVQDRESRRGISQQRPRERRQLRLLLAEKLGQSAVLKLAGHIVTCHLRAKREPAIRSATLVQLQEQSTPLKALSAGDEDSASIPHTNSRSTSLPRMGDVTWAVDCC